MVSSPRWVLTWGQQWSQLLAASCRSASPLREAVEDILFIPPCLELTLCILLLAQLGHPCPYFLQLLMGPPQRPDAPGCTGDAPMLYDGAYLCVLLLKGGCLVAQCTTPGASWQCYWCCQAASALRGVLFASTIKLWMF